MRCFTLLGTPGVNSGNFLTNVRKQLLHKNEESREQARKIFQVYNLSDADIEHIAKGNACCERMGDDFCVVLPGGKPGFPCEQIEPVNMALARELTELIKLIESKTRDHFIIEEKLTFARDVLKSVDNSMEFTH